METPPPSVNKVLILNYGSQYADLILRRCRDLGVYHKIIPYNSPLDVVEKFMPAGIILSGGPDSVYEHDAARLHQDLWNYIASHQIPTLGICYGMQDMHQYHGGKVNSAICGEFGPTEIQLNANGLKDPIFENYPQTSTVWMSHRDSIHVSADGFTTLAQSDNCAIVASSHSSKRMWSVQFHPEVMHSVFGEVIFRNFFKICGISVNSWPIDNMWTDLINKIKAEVQDRKIFAAISGGVDSVVAAAVLRKAIGRPFHGFLIDTGLLRKNEVRESVDFISKSIPDVELTVIDASREFFKALQNIKDPEEKRKRIGKVFIDEFSKAAQVVSERMMLKDGDKGLLLQGTICPDIIESAASKNTPSTGIQKIKTHHNVGGLPENMNFEVYEPLKLLFKDEVRRLGTSLGLDAKNLRKHPSPGPGLAVRIIGEVTEEHIGILREADHIFEDELRRSQLYDKVSQAFAVLMPECRTVGISGDSRTEGMTVALRAVDTEDFMTASFSSLPFEFLGKVSIRIIASVKEVNRVVYDVTPKPPGTIEWE